MCVPASPEDIQAAVHEVWQSRFDDIVQEVMKRLDAPVSPASPLPNRPLMDDADSFQAAEAPIPPTVLDENAPFSNKLSTEAYDALRKELAALENQLTEKRREMEAVIEEATNVRLAAEKEKFDAEAQAQNFAVALQVQINPLKAELESLGGQIAEDKKFIAEAAQVRLDKAQIAQDTAALAAQREKYEGYEREAQKARLLLEWVWPQWLRHPLLAAWKARIESQLSVSTISSSQGLLFAALHGCAAASRDTSDAKILYDALREVGRRLYTFLREDESASESDYALVAEQWAQAINTEYAGRGEVEAPVPGSAANSQWMTFQPRGGSSPDIVSVRSWCVRDAQKRPVHRAEVIV